MSLDLDKMLRKIRASQWALADVDWHAPGAELVTAEQKPLLKRFMADLTWIEQVGARGFAGMAKQTKDPTLKEIYRYFHAEEQRHANAELALMRRWGLLEDGERPQPNINLRMAIRFLDRHADGLPLAALGSLIPMLEIALDGALLKFLLETVKDPVCHEVFDKVNADESRHLAVDFHVLEAIGEGSLVRSTFEMVATLARPAVLLGLGLTYVPMLARTRVAIRGMGLPPERLDDAFRKYRRIGRRTPAVGRNLGYKLVSMHSALLARPRHPYHLFAKAMVLLTSPIPPAWLGPEPAWIRELSYEATS